MTADQLADLRRQSAAFWAHHGDSQAPHNVHAGAVRARREAQRRNQRRRWARVLAEIAQTPPR